MKAYRSLPEGYRQTLQINLQKDRKTMKSVSIWSAAALVLVLAAGALFVSPAEFLRLKPSGSFELRLGVLSVGYFLYIALHELTHAAVMKAVGGGKVRFGFTGLYAFAGSEEDYFDKSSYRCIALAPLIVWGIIFGVLAFALPRDWFWVLWFLQAGNISGAAGDVYVTVKLRAMPDTILVRDTGVDMTVYDRSAGTSG